MSDESVTKFLEQQTRTLKLSEAIRLGCTMVADRNDYCGCAMGAAWKAVTGRNLQIEQDNLLHNGVDTYGFQMVAKRFGVPEQICKMASDAHFEGRWTREQCADWLASQGL